MTPFVSDCRWRPWQQLGITRHRRWGWPRQEETEETRHLPQSGDKHNESVAIPAPYSKRTEPHSDKPHLAVAFYTSATFSHLLCNRNPTMCTRTECNVVQLRPRHQAKVVWNESSLFFCVFQMHLETMFIFVPLQESGAKRNLWLKVPFLK